MNKPSLNKIIRFYEFSIKSTQKALEHQKAIKKKDRDKELIKALKEHLALCTTVIESLIELQQYRENNKVE